MTTYGKAFWLDAFERALKSTAQAPVAAWMAAKMSNVFEVDWKSSLGIAAFAFVLSFLMSIGSAQVGSGNSASLVKVLMWLLVPCFLLCSVGCTVTPKSSAAEIRALYTEAQNQVNIAKTDPTIDKAKIADLQAKLDQAGPFIDALDVAASQAENDPTKWLDFQTLYIEYKPKVESILISLVLKRYLGV